jgi:hypothetical protein
MTYGIVLQYISQIKNAFIVDIVASEKQCGECLYKMIIVSIR